jgi:hypothetical protein
MTQDQIRRQALKAKDGVAKAQSALHVAKARLQGVQLMCQHPNKKGWKTSCMGDVGYHEECPDCLWERST